MKLVDQITQLTQTFDPLLRPSYNKHYIGFWLNGRAFNFATMRPRRSAMILELKIPQEEMQSIIRETSGEESELDIMEYDHSWGQGRIRLTGPDFSKNQETLAQLLRKAYNLRK